MRDIPGALRRKIRTFRSAWHVLGLRAALRVMAVSGRNSFVYWSGRTLAGLGLGGLRERWPRRAPRRHDAVLSVVIPVHDTPPDLLRACFDSVCRQSHSSWELCACDDCSSRADTLKTLATYRGSDPRIRIVRTERSLGIAGATNLAAEQASGEFLVLLDHDDELHPQALAEIAAATVADPDIDLLYTDEDKIEPDGSHSEPYFKPDWSPDHLHSVMYVLHCLSVRKSFFWHLGGLRSEYDGAQDYDLVLRASREARRIHHVPRVLYHWRKIPGSAAAEVDAKPFALAAAKRALADHARHIAPGGRVEDGLLPGTFRLCRSLSHLPPVTLVILSADPEMEVDGRGPVRLLPNLVNSITQTSTYPAATILVVDDGRVSQETATILDAAGARRVSFDDPSRPQNGFNYARKANFAVAHAETDLIVLLNDDLEVVRPDWIEALIEPLMDPAVAAVGGKLEYPDGRLQHAGVVLGVGGAPASHAFYGWPSQQVGYCAFTHVIRDYSAVTGAAMATRRSTFTRVGPFDEALAHDYNDIDFCLRARALGYRIVYTPFAELVHFEGATLRRTAQNPAEVALFRRRWRAELKRDPYYNPNLPRERSAYAM